MEKIFDSHSHYNNSDFQEDFFPLMQSLRDNGIGYLLNCGYDLESSKKAIIQAESLENGFMYTSAGFHPHDAKSMNSFSIDEIESLTKNPKVVAIGEIGLDYHYDFSPRDIQMQSFINQLDLAVRLNKPVIIHSREAMEDTINLLDRYKNKLQGVIHCYSGSYESCVQLVKMGFYIGFTGVVTFKNARRAIESLKSVPLDRLLIETDCPYMAPEPFRGKRCDSSMLHSIAEKIALETGISKDAIIAHTTENAKRLFNII